MADYDCLVEKHHGPEPFFTFGDKYKKIVIARTNPTRVVDDTKTKTHDRASAQGMLNRVYPDAIAVASPTSLVKWLPMVSAVVLLVMSVVPGGMFAVSVTLLRWYNPLPYFALAIFIAGILGAALVFRIAIWAPADRPLLFNRKRREVWALKISLPNFFRFWERPTTEIVKRPWDGIHVRTYRQTVASASMVTARRQLYLLWGAPDQPNLLDELAPLGTQTNWQDEVLFPLWEHVRRYMEEGGPAVPPGEQLGEYSQYPSPFPPEAIEAAGGAPYREAEVRRMAGLD